MLEMSEGKVQCKTARMHTWLLLHQAVKFPKLGQS